MRITDDAIAREQANFPGLGAMQAYYRLQAQAIMKQRERHIARRAMTYTAGDGDQSAVSSSQPTI